MSYSRGIATVMLGAIIIGIAAIVAATTVTVQNGSNGPTSPTQTYTPFTGTKEEVEYESISYGTDYVNDNTLEYGNTRTKKSGTLGRKEIKYKVTYEKDVAVSKEKISETVVTKPVNEVIAKGTKIVWHCVDVTSFDRNPNNDNKCTNSKGETVWVRDIKACQLDPTYSPGQSGPSYYNDYC